MKGYQNYKKFFFFFQNIKWEKAIGKPVTSKINLILILGLSLS